MSRIIIIEGQALNPITLTTMLNDDMEYVVVGTPKDGDGDPRIAARGTYDDMDDYAERNESPDNYERYYVAEVVA